MIAKMTRKPFYVAVESYKFARMYPLSQRDISDLCGDITINGPPTESPIAGKYDVGAVPESGASSVPLSGSALCASDVNHSNISLVSLDSDGGYSDSLTASTTPAIDFTPADYITLLFTDIGVLTPAAVSDELIRLYQ
jgi:translation initiation factor eIF-2B subunit alpha